MILHQIISAEKGKCCDLMPFGSLHEDRDKIHSFCEVREVEITGAIKVCRDCRLTFTKDVPFVESGQIGGYPTCIRCYERKHHLTSDSYREALRAEILLELKIKQSISPNH